MILNMWYGDESSFFLLFEKSYTNVWTYKWFFKDPCAEQIWKACLLDTFLGGIQMSNWIKAQGEDFKDGCAFQSSWFRIYTNSSEKDMEELWWFFLVKLRAWKNDPFLRGSKRLILPVCS